MRRLMRRLLQQALFQIMKTVNSTKKILRLVFSKYTDAESANFLT